MMITDDKKNSFFLTTLHIQYKNTWKYEIMKFKFAAFLS